MTLNIELGRPRKDGSCIAYLLISQAHDRRRVNSGIVLERNEYKYSAKGIKITNRKKNAMLSECLAKLENNIDSCPATVTPSKIQTTKVVETIKEIKANYDFIAFAEDWVDKCTKKGSKNYKSAIISFKKYIKLSSLSFDDLTPSLLERYQNSLSETKRAQSMYMSCLKHFWSEAERILDDDTLPKNPFRKVKLVKQKPVGQRAVDIKTINKIIEYTPEEGDRSELAKDCYILSFCFMGMNAVDLYNCETLENGVIKYDRTKVRERRYDRAHTEIIIHPYIEYIVNKYLSKNKKGNTVFNFSERYSTPEDFGRALNIGLKVIFGKDSKISFYTARHTWATIARNDLGIDKGTINDALVHVDRDMAITDLYIKKDYRLINEANEKVIEFVFGKYMKV